MYVWYGISFDMMTIENHSLWSVFTTNYKPWNSYPNIMNEALRGVTFVMSSNVCIIHFECGWASTAKLTVGRISSQY